MTLRNYKNDAPPIALTVLATVGATTLTVASTAGYPAAPFLLAIDRGTPTEEVVLCTALTATTFTVVRGYDGLGPHEHQIGASVEHGAAAIEFREANAHINSADGSMHFSTGMIGMTGAAAAPTGWLLCNGAAVSRTTYAALFNAIGTVFGVGDGVTTFNLPDLRDRVPIGANTVARGAASAIGSHNHTDIGHNHGHTITVDGNNFNTGGGGADHSHGFSSSTGGETNPGGMNHIHGNTAYGAGQWSGDQDHNLVHGHDFSGTTGGASAWSHTHNANHGHSVSGGIGNGAAQNQAANTHTAVGVNFIVKT